MSKFFLVFVVILLPMFSMFGQSPTAPTNPSPMAASAINSIGVDLLHQAGHSNENALLSPYSIETALAMTYAGSDGQTREEMARVLHLSGSDAQVANAFATLESQLNQMVQQSVRQSEAMKKYGASVDPMTLAVANRLFGQQGYEFRPTFLEFVKTNYHAPFEAMDFRKNSTGATKTINDWVAQQTQERIKDLVPLGALNRLTRLVLVNAIYLKVPWSEPFSESATKPLPFHPGGGAPVDVPTMTTERSFGYAKSNGSTIVRIPYRGGELQFLIILPNDVNGLAKVEAELNADKLAQWRALPDQPVRLLLPKFKLEPPTLPLGDSLRQLGMASAFDSPRGSANFDRIAPRHLPDDYLYISDVFHKTFISVDEKGTEAAAATAVVMHAATGIPMRPPQAIEVKVDHPFIFAIQHRASGACLFLGHVVDPR